MFYEVDDLDEANFSSTVFYGALPFAESEYWEDDSGKLLSKYENLGTDSDYISYVYDENSLMYLPIQNYINYFKNTLDINITARLITVNEIEDLGCTTQAAIGCINAPSWVSSTMYASGSVEHGGLYGITGKYSYSTIRFSDPFGVRPVITISKSEI